MKTDLYTKTILTIIAIALLFIAFKNDVIISSANAENIKFTKQTNEPVHVIVDEVDQYAFTYCTVPVKVK